MNPLTAAQNDRDARQERVRELIAERGLEVIYRVATDTPSPSPEANSQDASESEDDIGDSKREEIRREVLSDEELDKWFGVKKEEIKKEPASSSTSRTKVDQVIQKIRKDAECIGHESDRKAKPVQRGAPRLGGLGIPVPKLSESDQPSDGDTVSGSPVTAAPVVFRGHGRRRRSTGAAAVPHSGDDVPEGQTSEHIDAGRARKRLRGL